MQSVLASLGTSGQHDSAGGRPLWLTEQPAMLVKSHIERDTGTWHLSRYAGCCPRSRGGPRQARPELRDMIDAAKARISRLMGGNLGPLARPLVANWRTWLTVAYPKNRLADMVPR